MGDRKSSNNIPGSAIAVGVAAAAAAGGLLYYLFNQDSEQPLNQRHDAVQSGSSRTPVLPSPTQRFRQDSAGEAWRRTNSNFGTRTYAREITPSFSLEDIGSSSSDSNDIILSMPSLEDREDIETSNTQTVVEDSAEAERNIKICGICPEDLFPDGDTSSSPVEIPCNHYFHMACIMKWSKTNRSCPICSDQIPENLKTVYF